jgi:hypothetical protein
MAYLPEFGGRGKVVVSYLGQRAGCCRFPPASLLALRCENARCLSCGDSMKVDEALDVVGKQW